MSPTSMTTQASLLAPPTRRRLSPPRRLKWLVILGIVLLVSTAVGAMIMNQGAPSDSEKKVDGLPPGVGVLAQGVADADPKVADLNPSQNGQIMWLIAEGKVAKKGAVLLRIDNGSAVRKVEAAKAALAGAQAKLAVAKIGPEQTLIMEKQLGNAIEIAKQNKKVAELELDEARRAFDLKQISAKTVEIVEAKVKTAVHALSAEDNKRLELRLKDPQLDILQAEAAVAAAQAQLAEANWFLEQHDLKAPFDGTVLRVLVSVGEFNGPVPKLPAIQFCPSTPRIVRAEVLQEWSHLVQVGQDAIIEDDTKVGYKWKGRVKSVSDWFTERRSRHLEPFTFNDVRTLECIIEIVNEDRPLRIGQRVSINIMQGASVKTPPTEQ